MWKDLPENEKEEYKRMILAFASLTELFSQKNEENDEIPAPIINSKYQETIFQKAFHASAEDIGNTSYDVAINGKNIGNRLKKYLIGIKTFGIGSGDQKVAQFKANLNEWSSIINQMQKNAKNEDGTLKKKSEIDLVNNDLYKELAVKISILRNERICSSRANLQGFKVKDEDEVESVYHVLMPSSKGQTPEIYVGELNETKLYRSKVPFVLEEWLNDTNSFTNKISALLFRNKEEVEALIKANKEKYEDKLQSEEFTPYLLKAYNLKNSKSNIMNRLNELICKYEQKTRTITAYFLGMLLNKVSTNKNKTRIFRESVSEKTVCNFLELAFYAYSYFPNFANTQKLLSILSYVRDEYDILAHKEILQKLINRYAFVFEKGNLNDTINLILFCCQAKIEIPFHQEEKIVKSLREKDDPILWASYLLYAKYSKKYYQEIRNEIGQILQEQIAGIVQKESIFTYREFWWVLIFNKADCLTSVEQDKIDELIASIKTSTERSAGAILGRLFKEYLMNSSIQFFEWDMKKRDFLRNFTFMTKERSIFKNYQQNLNSLEWGSF